MPFLKRGKLAVPGSLGITHGGVALTEERLICTQEGVGSNPIASTTIKVTILGFNK